MSSTTVTVPANVNTLNVELDDAGTYIAVYDATTGHFMGRLKGVLTAGTYAVPVNSRGGTYSADVHSDATLTDPQPETGAAKKTRRPRLELAWFANAPSKEGAAVYDIATIEDSAGAGNGHGLRITLKDEEGSTVDTAGTVSVLRLGTGVSVTTTGSTDPIDSIDLVSGTVDVNVFKKNAGQLTTLRFVVRDSETKRSVAIDLGLLTEI